MDLGEEKKQKIKLEEKLEKTDKLRIRESSSVVPTKLQESSSPRQAAKSSSFGTDNVQETLCSMCANKIVDYVPEYFLGECFNPASMWEL